MPEDVFTAEFIAQHSMADRFLKPELTNLSMANRFLEAQQIPVEEQAQAAETAGVIRGPAFDKDEASTIAIFDSPTGDQTTMGWWSIATGSTDDKNVKELYHEIFESGKSLGEHKPSILYSRLDLETRERVAQALLRSGVLYDMTRDDAGPRPTVAHDVIVQAWRDAKALEKRTGLPEWLPDTHNIARDIDIDPARYRWRSLGKQTLGEIIERHNYAPLRERLQWSVENVPFIGGFFKAERLREIRKAGKEIQRWHEGELDLTSAEVAQRRSLLANFIEKSEEIQVRGHTIPAKIGMGIRDLLPYAIEMYATSGIYSTVSRGVAARAAATLPAVRGAATAAQAAGWVAGSLGRTMAMGGRIAASQAQRQGPAVTFTTQGDLLMAEPKEGPVTGFFKAFGDVMIENMSEVAGEKLVSAAGKVLTVPGKRVLSKFPRAKTAIASLGARLKDGWMKATGGSADTFYRQMLKKGGYDGILGEMGEERLGDFARAAIGIDTYGFEGDKNTIFKRLAGSLPDGEQLLVELGVFSLPAGASFLNTALERRKEISMAEKFISAVEAKIQAPQTEEGKQAGRPLETPTPPAAKKAVVLPQVVEGELATDKAEELERTVIEIADKGLRDLQANEEGWLRELYSKRRATSEGDSALKVIDRIHLSREQERDARDKLDTAIAAIPEAPVAAKVMEPARRSAQGRVRARIKAFKTYYRQVSAVQDELTRHLPDVEQLLAGGPQARSFWAVASEEVFPGSKSKLAKMRSLLAEVEAARTELAGLVQARRPAKPPRREVTAETEYEAEREELEEHIADLVEVMAETDPGRAAQLAEAVEGVPAPTTYSITENPPETVVTREAVDKAFPGSQISDAENGWRVDLPNGHYFDIQMVDEIVVDWDAAEKQLGRKITKAERETLAGAGSFEISTSGGYVITGLGLIQLSKHLATESTLRHEAFHLADQAGLFTEAEWDALISEHSDRSKSRTEQEEDIAQAHAAWQPKTGLVRKITGWIRGLLKKLGITKALTAEQVHGLMEHAEFWARVPKPTVKGSRVHLVFGRPDLANPATDKVVRRFIDELDEGRKRAGLPPHQYDKDVQREARERLEADYIGERDGIYAKARSIGMLDAVEVKMAKEIINREGVEALKSGEIGRISRFAEMVDAMWRVPGTTTARALRQRYDLIESPRQRRHRVMLESVLGLRSRNSRKINKARDAKNFTEVERLLEEEAAEINRVWYELKKREFTPEEIEKIAEDPVASAKFLGIVHTLKGNLFDMLFEWRMNAMFSSPLTHFRNIFGTISYAPYRMLVRRFVEAGVAKVFGIKDAATFSEFRYMFAGFLPGIMRGARQFVLAWQSETPMLGAEIGYTSSMKFEGPQVAIPGRFGRFVRSFGYRPLLAADEFFKSIVAQMEVGAHAYRVTKEEGLTGEPMQARISELMMTPWERAYMLAQEKMRTEGLDPRKDRTKLEETAAEIFPSIESPAWDAAIQAAREYTFQDRESNLIKALLKFRKIPGVRHVIPIITTPTNLFRIMFWGTAPIAAPFAAAKTWKAVREGDWKAIPPIAATQALAWAVWLYLFASNDEDDPWITGAESEADWKTRSAARRTYPAQSFKIGDKWISYSNLDPLAGALAMIVDTGNAIKRGENIPAMIASMWRSLKGQLKDKTYLRSIGDLIRAAEESTSEKRLGAAARDFITSFFPNIVKTVGRSIKDQYPSRRVWGKGPEWWQRLGRRILQKMELGWPYVDEPAIDVWGREAKKYIGKSQLTDFLFRTFVPTRIQREEIFVGDRILMNWNNQNPDKAWLPGMPDPVYSFEGQRKWMSEPQYTRFLQVSGRLARALVDSEFPEPDDPTEQDIKTIKSAFNQSRSLARRLLIREWEQKISADIEMGRLVGALRGKRIASRAKALIGYEPKSLTSDERFVGLTLKQKRFKWYRDREQALEWLRRRQLSKDAIIRNYARQVMRPGMSKTTFDKNIERLAFSIRNL